MRESSPRGFTLIEVVLAIAVGLIITAGVSVGYTYAKRTAILDNQRKNLAAIKTWLEQAIASQQANMPTGGGPLKPPPITAAQLGQLSLQLPSLRFDPYTGQERFTSAGVPTGCGGSCIFIVSGTGFIFTSAPAHPSQLGIGWPKGKGSGVGYLYCGSFTSCVISIPLADGTTKRFDGFAVVETDEDGNFVAAEGGSLANL